MTKKEYILFSCFATTMTLHSFLTATGNWHTPFGDTIALLSMGVGGYLVQYFITRLIKYDKEHNHDVG